MQSFKMWASAAMTLALAACGGGSGGSTAAISAASTTTTPAPTVATTTVTAPARGELIQSPPSRAFAASAEAFAAGLNSTADGKSLLKASGTPTCGIDVRYFQYGTVGAKGEATTASGALMVPTGTSANCTGTRPIVLYAHGTAFDRRFNMANMQDDTNMAQGEAYTVAAMYAAQGYIVVAPNYAGYDSSTLPYHPYLNADQQSKDMMDALAAAKTALPTLSPGVVANAKLFIVGYSQGGSVTMATHRAMQAAGIPVTASAPMAGAYTPLAQSDAIFYGYIYQWGPFFSTLIGNSFQKAYGNMYTTPSDFYEAPYATDIETVLPGPQNSLGVLVASGKLPKAALFSNTPLAITLPASTAPLTGPAAEALFASGFGTNNLIKNSARQAYLADAVANPDGTFPTLTTGLPSAAPAHPLRMALKKNDLRGWTPTSPVMMCSGIDDPMVYSRLNTSVMANYWAGLPAGLVTVLDVDSLASSPGAATDPYYSIKFDFAQAKAATLAARGATGLLQVYHTDLASFACFSAARKFIAQF